MVLLGRDTLPVPVRWNVWSYPALSQRLTKIIAFAALVYDPDFGASHSIRKQASAEVIVSLSFGQKRLQWSAILIENRMQL